MSDKTDQGNGSDDALTLQSALEVARNNEDEIPIKINEYLEQAISDIWCRVQAQPYSYILTKDEFAVFNYYVHRFEGDSRAQQAIARYWQQASAEPGS
ncbi:hypothetical protein KC333_g6395 [Hortaea werneckii]|nr:hypothetical protein KC333_g6395 [Hortaea werneckii]KAI7315230.1 hypothetical protein KC326_g4755 [Hortaea werneckii]